MTESQIAVVEWSPGKVRAYNPATRQSATDETVDGELRKVGAPTKVGLCLSRRISFVREARLPDTATHLYRAAGCAECGGSGYRGRIAIIEILIITDPIRTLILRHADAHEIGAAAVGQGMRTMYQDGVEKALAGITTLEEILRVTQAF